MIAIRAEELSKTYKLYKRPIDRLVELITTFPRHSVFPALQDVSFEIRQGETIGLIGQNGAGKSTLLKLLCGVTKPSTGVLETHGTISSILELGTGFHPEFTGRDNAALNAAILGLSPREIRQMLPAILEFSELGNFLDQPVKTYSSGMYMRLAFSVAVNVDPDILVIDEALAVGDGHFQKKCIDRLRDFQARKKTIFFCSHALYYISSLCDRTLWLDRGTMMRFGNSADVLHEYESFLLAKDAEQKAADQLQPEPPVEYRSPVRLVEVSLRNAAGERVTSVTTGERVELFAVIESDDPSQPIHVLAAVDRSADSMQCFTMSTMERPEGPFSGSRRYEVRAEIHSMPLVRGEYDLVVFAGDEHALHIFDRVDLRPAFSVAGDRFHVGMVRVPHEWRIDRASLPESR